MVGFRRGLHRERVRGEAERLRGILSARSALQTQSPRRPLPLTRLTAFATLSRGERVDAVSVVRAFA
jgi:hypothetical protein